MNRIAFLASGNGSNAENLIQKIQMGEISAEYCMVICDKPGAGVIDRAKALDVDTVVIDRKSYESKHEFETVILRELREKKIEYVVLAGFMRVLSDTFVRAYLGKMINIHPSYLPAFKGAHAIQDAFEAKAKETGVTVHFVDPEVDSGPIILQRKVSVNADDTLESLEERVHAVEYEIFPEALSLVLSGEATYPSA